MSETKNANFAVRLLVWHDEAFSTRVFKTQNLWPLGFIILLILLAGHYFLLHSALHFYQTGPLPHQFLMLYIDKYTSLNAPL